MTAPQHILLIAHDLGVRSSRSAVMVSCGFSVHTAISNDEGIQMIRDGGYSLVVIGRDSVHEKVPLDQRLRREFPNLYILKIDHRASEFASLVVNKHPEKFCGAVRDRLAGTGGPPLSVPPA